MQEAKEKQKGKNKRGGEKMKNNGKRKYQKGITLIALVITIIVLLILARSEYSNVNRAKWNIDKSKPSK